MPNTAKTSGKSDIPSLMDKLNQDQIRQFVADYLFVPQNEAEYDNLMESLKVIILYGQDTPDSPFNGLISYMGYLAKQYEEKHYPIPKSTPREVLQFLMEEHHLKQADLPEIGNQAKVSEVLNGKRSLNVNQIKKLSERFKVSPSLFL